MSSRIRYDFNGLMADRIGDQGLVPADIVALEARLEIAQAEQEKMRQKKVAGFWDLPYQEKLVKQILGLAESMRAFDHFVVIGIGGSSLGAQALHASLRHPYYNQLSPRQRGKRPCLYFPDNIDPDALAPLLDVLDLKKTVFNIVSKSGDTAAGMATFLWLVGWVEKAVGARKLSRHFVLTTDVEKGSLRKIANELGCATLPIPGNVSGRFSVLTSAGLFPAAASGIDIKKLLAGAAGLERLCRSKDWRRNPALAGAGFHYLLQSSRGKSIQVFMPYSQSLRELGDWFLHLAAESLGKALDRGGRTVNVGQTPIRALGVTDQYSQLQLFMEGPCNKVFTFVTTEQFANRLPIPRYFSKVESVSYLGGHKIHELFTAEQRATELALHGVGRPTCAIRLPKIDEKSIGGLIYLLQAQTAYLGELHNINAFNQPGVELVPQFTYGMLGRAGFEDRGKQVKMAPVLKKEFVIGA